LYNSREKTRELFLVFLLTGVWLAADPGNAPGRVHRLAPAAQRLRHGGSGAAAVRQQRRSAQPYSWQQEVTQVRDGRCLFEVVDGVPVVTAPEEIDITNTPELRSALLEASAHGHGTLVVDMTRTQFCDSSGLHALLAAHKRAQAEGGELLLAITAAPVLRILALTSIDRMIPNFTSLDEALAQTSANGSNGHQRADRALPDLPHDRSR
jgi:anti-sigma B factor antagonist